MKPRSILLALAMSALLAHAAPPAPSASPSLPIFFDSSAAVLPSDPDWSAALNEKLAAFQDSHGTAFLVRLHAKSPPAEEDKVPGAYMRALATELGTAQSGLLAVYFADEDDWRLWIGDDLTATFSGKPGTPKELTKNGAIHDAKEALFATAATRRDSAFAALQKIAPPDHPPSPAKRIQFHTEAVIDEVIKKFPVK